MTTSAELPRFILRVQRSETLPLEFAVDFRVDGGAARLRVARPGEVASCAASTTGEVRKLTAAQLQASRFEILWDRGRRRRAYTLNRLGERTLGQLVPGRWEDLAEEEGNTRRLVLVRTPSAFGLERLDPAPVRGTSRKEEASAEPEEDTDEGSVEEVSPVVTALSSDPVVPPAAAATTNLDRMAVGSAIGPGQSALVRHLRRRQARDAREIARLRVECRRLHKLLKDAGIPH